MQGDDLSFGVTYCFGTPQEEKKSRDHLWEQPQLYLVEQRFLPVSLSSSIQDNNGLNSYEEAIRSLGLNSSRAASDVDMRSMLSDLVD